MIIGVIECTKIYNRPYYVIRSTSGKALGEFRKTRNKRYKGFTFVPTGILMTAKELREVAYQLDELNQETT